MAWEVLGRTYYSDSDLTDATVYQGMQFDFNVVLKAVRVWVIVYNDPTFTSLNMKIYSNQSSAPGSVLYTSTNTWAKADVHTSDYAVKELYFEFNDVALISGKMHYFVINASGYSGASATSHLAWKYAYPDPVYETGVTLDKVKAGTYPLNIYPIFARFDTP